MSSKLKSMSSFPSCFHPPFSAATTTTTTTTTSPNLTTSLYQTPIGLISLSWSRSLFSRSLHLILPNSSSSFHLSLKPFLFWSHSGTRKLNDNSLFLFWDFSRATFRPHSSPDPTSSFYLALYSTSSNSTLLFLGDLLPSYRSTLASYNFTDTTKNNSSTKLVVRREHVCGAHFYATNTTIGGKSRHILIDLINKPDNDDPRLVIRFDNTRVIQVKHLKWKFRGSERFDVDGHRVHLSWDVYNWLFDDSATTDDNYALFTFRFEADNSDDDKFLMWGHDSCGLSYERKKMRKKLVVKTSSSSSSSLSSTSSSGSSSVMEWESVEENELKAPTGFSLLVYAWKI